MISWRSYTTSKVLPTFVGESSTTASTSYRRTQASGFDYAGRFVGDVTETSSGKITISPTLTKTESSAGATAGQYEGPTFAGQSVFNRTGEVANARALFTAKDIVIQNSTIFNGTRTHTSPLATIRQESTKTESYESGYRSTKTISAYEDEEGNAEPLRGYIWTTTVTGTGTDAKTTFEQVETDTTETVQDYKTREGKRTVITTGSPIEVTTYTAMDGDVVVIAHTIWEATNAVSFDSPQTEIPVTQLAFAPTRFTLSYFEAYTKALPIRDDSQSTKSVTTIQTIIENHETTTRGFSNESYKGWYLSYETRTCENRTDFTVYTEIDDEGNEQEYTEYDGVNRFTPESYKLNHGFTVESQTILNTTQESFKTFFGFNTEIFTGNYTTGIRNFERFDTPGEKRTSTRYVPNTVSEQTTTFSVSGDLFTSSSQDWPGQLNRNVFPWITIGDEARRYFNLPNNQTTIFSTKSQLVTFGHTWNIKYLNENITQGIAGTKTEEFEAKKVGQFYQKNVFQFIFGAPAPVPTSERRTNTATAIAFVHAPFEDHGLASPQLTFRTQNTHATVGAFMSDNAEHTWQADFGETRGFISQGVVGAAPLYPTFSGRILRDSEGWELCDTSEITSVTGSRVGQNFTTTIEWQTVKGTSTKNSTSSGSFTIQSTTVATVRAQNITPTIAGGFATPNASRTVIVSPGVVLMTTYDASSSGTLSTSYSTGTTETTAPVGPVPITLSSFLPRVQGYGVFTQSLLDDGMP